MTLRPMSRNLVLHSHATTSLSLAYGLCFGGGGAGDAALEAFVETPPRASPRGPRTLVLGGPSIYIFAATSYVREVLGLRACVGSPPPTSPGGGERR
jgi:hypothetical protein